MTKTKPAYQPLLPSNYYHIFNRGNNKGQLFYKEENYHYFLEKCRQYMDGYWDIYAWALMGNHFHFLVRVKPVEILEKEASVDFKKIGRLFYNHHQMELLELCSVSHECRVRLGLTGFQNLLDLGALSALQTQLLNLPLTQLLKSAKQHNKVLHQQMLSWTVSERFRRFLMGYAKAINKQQNRTGSLFQDRFKSKQIKNKKHAKTVLKYIHHNPIHHNIAVFYNQYCWTSYMDYLSGKNRNAIRWFNDIANFKREHTAYRMDIDKRIEVDDEEVKN